MIYAKVISVAETQSGNPKYRATIVFEDVNGKPLTKARTVEANGKLEFKAAIRPLVQQQVGNQDREATITALAQEALAEVIAEETGA